MNCFEDEDDYLILNIRAVPRASRDGFAERMGNAVKLRIQAPPIDGKANAYLINFLSKHWKIPKSAIEIVSGETGRSKRIRISHPSDEIRKELLSFSVG